MKKIARLCLRCFSRLPRCPRHYWKLSRKLARIEVYFRTRACRRSLNCKRGWAPALAPKKIGDLEAMNFLLMECKRSFGNLISSDAFTILPSTRQAIELEKQRQQPAESRTAQHSGRQNTAPRQGAQNGEKPFATPPTQTIAIYNQPSRNSDKDVNKNERDAIDVQRQLAEYTSYFVVVGIVFWHHSVACAGRTSSAFFQQKQIMGEHKKSFEELASAVRNLERPWVLAKAHLR